MLFENWVNLISGLIGLVLLGTMAGTCFLYGRYKSKAPVLASSVQAQPQLHAQPSAPGLTRAVVAVPPAPARPRLAFSSETQRPSSMA